MELVSNKFIAECPLRLDRMSKTYGEKTGEWLTLGIGTKGSLMESRSAKSTWSVTDPIVHLDDLLDAASEVPQRIRWRGRNYILQAENDTGRAAQDFLMQGGPIEREDKAS